jgi:hypothetical protein
LLTQATSPDNRPKSLIKWMEATTRIELVYTVLQFACCRVGQSS